MAMNGVTGSIEDIVVTLPDMSITANTIVTAIGMRADIIAIKNVAGIQLHIIAAGTKLSFRNQ